MVAEIPPVSDSGGPDSWQFGRNLAICTEIPQHSTIVAGFRPNWSKYDQYVWNPAAA
jgi:hypothetical protein